MDELLNNDTLNTLMGDILVELIEEQIERDKNEQGNRFKYVKDHES